jgi:hypothetical protein
MHLENRSPPPPQYSQCHQLLYFPAKIQLYIKHKQEKRTEHPDRSAKHCSTQIPKLQKRVHNRYFIKFLAHGFNNSAYNF